MPGRPARAILLLHAPAERLDRRQGELLKRERVGLERLNHLRDAGVDLADAVRKRLARGPPHNAGLDETHLPAVGVDDAVAGDVESGVDAEDTHGGFSHR